MKNIELTDGSFALVDDEDYDRLSVYTWWKTSWGYVVRRPKLDDGTRKVIFMHREILGLLDKPEVFADHRNGVRTDNQRHNLRECTRTENNRNRPRQSNNTTGYKGVSKASGSTYRAQIKVNGEKIYLGAYPTPEEAYQVYCEAAKKYHGEFFRPD